MSLSAAFDVSNKFEAARILRDLANKVAAGETYGKIRDISGKDVGSWSYSED